MPCEQCEDGKYKWGVDGECQYLTLEDCQLANQENFLEEAIKPEKTYSETPVDYTLHFSEEQMEMLHTEGELMVEVEGSEEGEKMNILFTYDVKKKEEEIEEETEELEIGRHQEIKKYSELTVSLLDDELDEYINKLTDAIKTVK
jgi:hypothetical protein